MKNKFIKSTIILIIGGLISKVLGMIIKISLTRIIKTEGIGLYSLILPSFNLFITLCSLGLPIAISKLVSENKINSKKIILPIIPLLLTFNLLLIIIIILSAKSLSITLLHNKNTYYPLIAIALTLPFISISSILKGYFYGKEKMLPATLSTIIEQIVRLLLVITIIPKLIKISLVKAIIGTILINIISEFSSIIILLIFIPQKYNIKITDFKYNKKITKNLLNISIPTTGSRLIGSISYFLEPIILTSILTKTGYNSSYITIEYGIINGYIYPLLLLPSFFTLAISNALLPIVSNNFTNRNYQYTKYKIKQAIKLSLIIGIPCTLIFMTIPEIPLKLIYNTTEGINYIKIISPFFILLYIQGPLTASMQAMNKAKEAMIGTLTGALIKTILLIVLSYLKIGIWSLIISNITNIIYITIQHYYYTFIKKN